MAFTPTHLSRFASNQTNVLNFLWSKSATDYLYEPQIQALRMLQSKDACAPGRIALVVLPTGCGKTGVAALAPYVLGVRNVLVLTPSVIILRQIHEAFCGVVARQEQETVVIYPSFYEKRGIITTHRDRFCPSSSGIILRANQFNTHVAENKELLVVNVHKIAGRSNVKIEEIDNEKFDLVIVDEAHHYPAPMWKRVVDHFCGRNVRVLFLTATPAPIIPNPIPEPCYQLSRRRAVELGIIRDMDDRNIQEVGNAGENLEIACLQIANKVEECLNAHDQAARVADSQRRYYHQAMVIAQTKEGLNDADTFQVVYNTQNFYGNCEKYVSGTDRAVLESFDRGEIRTLVVVGKLREGYDNKYVSVVAILRKIAATSRVLFAQLIGRAVRKLHANDPVNVAVISHHRFRQRGNYENFMREEVAEIENDDDQNDLTEEDQDQAN